jgi:hypothetical protein
MIWCVYVHVCVPVCACMCAYERDTATVGVTPLALLRVPPPMSAFSLRHACPVRHVAFGDWVRSHTRPRHPAQQQH